MADQGKQVVINKRFLEAAERDRHNLFTIEFNRTTGAVEFKHVPSE